MYRNRSLCADHSLRSHTAAAAAAAAAG